MRRVAASDFDAYFNWYRDERIQRHLANPWWDPMLSRDDYYQLKFRHYLTSDGASGVLTICDSTAAPLGLVNYFDLQPSIASCEVGIIVGVVARWRQGIAAGALRLLIDYLNLEKGVNCIRARILEDNFASQKLFEKVGFARVGKSTEMNWSFLNYEWRSGEAKDATSEPYRSTD